MTVPLGVPVDDSAAQLRIVDRRSRVPDARVYIAAIRAIGRRYALALLIAVALGLLTIVLLYRRIDFIAKLTVSFWVGTMVVTGLVIVTGAVHFDPKVAFDFPPDAFHFSLGFVFGLGAASRIGVYDYLGYYDVCYIGDEVKNPGKVIPASIIISVVGVALIYLAVNLSLVGFIPWREFVPADEKPAAKFIVSIFMDKIYGPKVAVAVTVLILWATLGSVFALLLGYSRIPYAAALDGYFFKAFGRLHPQHRFPHVSLLVRGGMAMGCSLLPLGTVIDALLTTRILVQFIGQIVAVALLRRRSPQMVRPYRIWLYPLPSLVALLGWIFIFATSDWKLITLGLGSLALGGGFFLIWSWRSRRWPFGPASQSPAHAA